MQNTRTFSDTGAIALIALLLLTTFYSRVQFNSVGFLKTMCPLMKVSSIFNNE
jgi:hypothetical protein